MIAPLRRWWDRFRGGGEAGVTVPPMDGSLRPNRLLEEAPAVLTIKAPDNLATDGRRVLFSSGNAVLKLEADGKSFEVARFEHPVNALALASDGTLAVGLGDGSVMVQGAAGERKLILGTGERRFVCPTALLFTASDELLIAQGSATLPASEWRRDLMDRGATGSVWLGSIASGGVKLVADRLSWPYGVGMTGGRIAITESWRHRIVTVDPKGGNITPVLEDLPGYPARLTPAGDAGWWLAVFAPRGQLIEFVQREPKFRARMMAEVDPDHWVSPSLKPSSTFLEPLQGGAQKHLGMLKPWAPTRSYGLVVKLDRQFRPVFSFHSRADGRRHGVTSCIEAGGRVLATSRGGDTIVQLDPAVAKPAAMPTEVSP